MAPVERTGSAEAEGHGLELMKKFVCSQCWRDGMVSEPNWELKYSSYKQTDLSLCLSLFIWTKDRRVLLSRLTRGRNGSQFDLFPLPNPFFNNTTWVKTTNLLSLKSRWDEGWHGGFPPNINQTSTQINQCISLLVSLLYNRPDSGMVSGCTTDFGNSTEWTKLWCQSNVIVHQKWCGMVGATDAVKNTITA